MDAKKLRRLKAEANEAFAKRDYKLTLSLSKELAEDNVPSAIFTCGLIFEKGWMDGAIDFDLAYFYYEKLALLINSDEGYLGCARIILARRDTASKNKALSYALGATMGKSKHAAFTLLGRIYEELCDPPMRKEARKAYLKSFFSGSAWGLRQYAISLTKSKNYLLGITMHIVATIVAPIFVIFGGLRRTRNG